MPQGTDLVVMPVGVGLNMEEVSRCVALPFFELGIAPIPTQTSGAPSLVSKKHTKL
jgi:hypothetical protein